jgi:hypothetical protein
LRNLGASTMTSAWGLHKPKSGAAYIDRYCIGCMRLCIYIGRGLVSGEVIYMRQVPQVCTACRDQNCFIRCCHIPHMNHSTCMMISVHICCSTYRWPPIITYNYSFIYACSLLTQTMQLTAVKLNRNGTNKVIPETFHIIKP